MAHVAGIAAVIVWGSAVSGPTTCPAPAAVEASLPGSSADALHKWHEHVELTRTDTFVKLELLDAENRGILERALTTSGSCAGLAAASAAVIGAMELELHGSPPVVALPSLPQVRNPEVVAPPPTAARAGGGISVDLGAAVLGSLSGDAVAPAGGLTLAIAWKHTGLRLGSAFFAEARRSLTFTAGSAGYQRFWLAVGPAYEVRWDRFSLELGLAATGALLSLSGDGTTSLASASAFEAGAALDLEAKWSFGSWGVWGGLFVLTWPADTKVAISALNESRSLPIWEGLLGAGIQFNAL